MTATESHGYMKPNASGPLIRNLRMERGYTVGEAARILGCSAGTLRRWERDGLTKNVRINRLLSICRAYGISSDRLFEAAMLPAHALAGCSTPVARV